MSSYLQQFLSIEQEVLDAENQIQSEDEAVEVAGEVEAARQEAEAMGSEIQRSSAVLDEVDNQNQAIRAIVEKNGELTPEAAAGFEVARRTAVAGLGLDPESEAAQGVVDEAGLESMVLGRGVLALEEAEKTSENLWAKIKKIWEAFVARCKEFWKWLMKLTNFVDKRYKEAYNKVRAMSDEEFNTKVEALKKTFLKLDRSAAELKGVYNWLTPDGKLFDIDAEAGNVFKMVDGIHVAGRSVIDKIIKGEVKSTDEANTALSVAMDKKEVKFCRYAVRLSSQNTGSYGLYVHIDNSVDKGSLKDVKFTRKDLENVLNVGTRLTKRIDTLVNDAEKLQEESAKKIKEAVEKAKDNINKEYKNAPNDAIKINTQIFAIQSKCAKLLSDGLKGYLALANKVTGAKATEEGK